MQRFQSEGQIVADIYHESVVLPLQAQIAKLSEYIELLENQVIVAMTADDDLVNEIARLTEANDELFRKLDVTRRELRLINDGADWEKANGAPRTEWEKAILGLDQPVPYLPADPEEQRRRDVQASDGEQCMIYRGRS